MIFLPVERKLCGLLLSLALLLPAPVAFGGSESAQSLARLGQSLCEVAFDGGLPSVAAAPLRRAAGGAAARDQVCGCTGQSLSQAPPSVLSGLLTELAVNFSTHALLDDVIADHLTPCLAVGGTPPGRAVAAGDPDEGPGDYPFVIPAMCELALDGGTPAWGVTPTHFTEALRQAGRSREMFCACTTDQMVGNYRALSRAVKTESTDGEAFSRYLGISMTHCLRHPPAITDLPAHSDEARAICEEALKDGPPGGPERRDLTRWLEGSGLSTDDLCTCAASGVVPREPDARGREDRSAVLRAVSDCQRILWRG